VTSHAYVSVQTEPGVFSIDAYGQFVKLPVRYI